MPEKALEGLEDALGYRFGRLELLELALTHSSFANEQNFEAVEDNERLEFLGDSVLGFLVSDWLCEVRPDLKEGDLSRLKAHLVSAANLRRYGERLGLGQYLRLGKGEEKTGGRRKQALLVNSFEAVLAAVYRDGGLEAAARVARRLFESQIDDIAEGGDPVTNFKSSLQETLQSDGRGTARYRVIGETGPEHERRFTVEAVIDGEAFAEGTGATKKAAEQAAAKRALEILKEPDGGTR